MTIKFPIGTILIALAGENAYRGDVEAVRIPPDTVGVVVDLIESTHEYLLSFPSHKAGVLLDEKVLDDRKRYVALSPATVARMLERLRVSLHSTECVLAALGNPPPAQAVELAKALASSEHLAMSAFLDSLLRPPP